MLCQKQATRAWTRNYITQYLRDVIICPCPWYLVMVQWASSPHRILPNVSGFEVANTTLPSLSNVNRLKYCDVIIHPYHNFNGNLYDWYNAPDIQGTRALSLLCPNMFTKVPIFFWISLGIGYFVSPVWFHNMIINGWLDLAKVRVTKCQSQHLMA